jgi:hypothetical protein
MGFHGYKVVTVNNNNKPAVREVTRENKGKVTGQTTIRITEYT